MICILKTDQQNRGRWLFATDMPDARRQAEANDEPELAAPLDDLKLDRPQALCELRTGHVLFID